MATSKTSGVRPALALGLIVALSAVLSAAEPASPLDKLDPDKITAARRQGQPKALVAVIGEKQEFKNLEHTHFSVAFHPKGKLLAIAIKATTRLWDLSGAEPRLQAELEGTHPSFSPDGKTLAVCRGEPVLMDLAGSDVKERTTLKGERLTVYSLAFAPDGNTLAVGYAGKIRLWDVSGDQPKAKALLTYEGRTEQLVFAPDAKRLATGGKVGKVVQLWDLRGAEPQKAQSISREPFPHQRVLAFSTDGTTLAAAGSLDRQICLWDVAEQEPKKRLILTTGASKVRAAVFVPDGKAIVCLNEDGQVVLWELPAGKKLREWQLAKSEGLFFGMMALSPDGRHLAVTHATGLTYVLDLATP